MKKLVLTTVCGLAMTGFAFAQGTVAWNVISPAAMTAQTNATTFSSVFGAGGGSTGGGTIGATATAATGFYYELLYNTFTGSQLATPTSLSSLSTWSDTGLEATNSTSNAGFLAPIAGSTAATVPWANGVTNSIMLVGWSANLGTTWGVALSNLTSIASLNIAGPAYFGESVTGYINPNAANPGATLFSASATSSGLPIKSLNTQLFIVNVPEPTTIALAALGGASLLLFRRRKS
jgi:hypothetical protein